MSSDATEALRSLPATINPYRHALLMVLDRLRWDCTWESHRSRRKLRAWRDRHSGGRAVILCNGPSLLRSDLRLLDGVFTFGLNKINLLFEKSDFRPSCVVAVNPLVIEQNADFYNTTSLPLFLDRHAIGRVRGRKNVVMLHAAGPTRMARDCSLSIQQGCTVTFVAMQLAFHMGFRRVALIGCDHSFAQKGPANQCVVAEGADASHFDPRYFSGGQRWHLPDLAASEYYYSIARDTYEAFGGEIVNCTPGGKLEIFRRQDLVDWVRE